MAGNKEYLSILNYLYTNLNPDLPQPEWNRENEKSFVSQLMQKVREGELLRPDGSRFPAGITTEDFFLEAARMNKRLSELKTNRPDADQKEFNDLTFIWNTGNGFRYLADNKPAVSWQPNAEELSRKETEEELLRKLMTPKKDPRKPDFSVAEALACDDVIRSVSDLLHDLRKTDSFFSSDSDEYRQFRTALETVEKDLAKKPAIQSTKALQEIFSQKIRIGDQNMSLAGYAMRYEQTKEAHPGDLSSRQISRLSVCKRLNTIKELVSSERFENVRKNGRKDPGFLREIQKDKLIHKTLLAKVKNASPAGKSLLFRDAELYEKEISILKKNKNIEKASNELRSLNDLSRRSGDALLEALEIRTERNYDAARKALQINNMSNNRIFTNPSVIAQYLVLRSTEMLQELQSGFSMTHSDAFYDFKSGLTDLRDNLLNLDPAKMRLSDIQEILSSADRAAEAYRKQHANDTPDLQIAQRLGLAAEIRLCCEYLNTPAYGGEGPTVSGLLEAAHAHKCMLDDVVSKKRTDDLADLARFMTDNRLPRDAGPAAEDPKQADLDFKRHFKVLTDPDTYSRALRDYKESDSYQQHKAGKGSVDLAQSILGKKRVEGRTLSKTVDENRKISQNILGMF